MKSRTTQAKFSAATVRPATADDLPAIQGIYAHHVLSGLATYEEIPPGLDEMRRRFLGITNRGLPYLVAVSGKTVVGYGYCDLFRLRSAYRFSLEDSVYIRDRFQGKGIGRALLGELISRSTALGYRQLIAVIGDSANAGSIRLHASLGFLRAGVLRSSGFKFGRWVDTLMMQRPLGSGDGTLPSGDPDSGPTIPGDPDSGPTIPGDPDSGPTIPGDPAS